MVKKLIRYSEKKQPSTAVRVDKEAFKQLREMAMREDCSNAEIVRYLLNFAHETNMKFE